MDKVYYRGTEPGRTERITTGSPTWDSYLFVADDPKKARNYGSSIEKITLKPDAKVLREGTRDFILVAGKWRKGESLLAYATRAAEQAKEAGYDAIHFKMQGDVGTAILNRDAVLSREPFEMPTAKTAIVSLENSDSDKAFIYTALNKEWQKRTRIGKLTTNLGAFGTYEVHAIDLRDEPLFAIYDPTHEINAGFAIFMQHAQGAYESDRIAFAPEYQGFGLGAKFYSWLLKGGICKSIMSGSYQSLGGRSTWEQLAKMPGVLVYGWNKKTDQAFSLDPNDLSAEEEMWSADRTDEETGEQLPDIDETVQLVLVAIKGNNKTAAPHDQETFPDGPSDFFEPVENPHSTQPLRATAATKYTAYVLTDIARKHVLKVFPPKFPDVIAHHVTYQLDGEEAPPPAKIMVEGYASDDSLEALVVSVDGETTRPDGEIYHITLSLDREQGRSPKDSKDVCKAGWTPVSTPFGIQTIPQKVASGAPLMQPVSLDSLPRDVQGDIAYILHEKVDYLQRAWEADDIFNNLFGLDDEPKVMAGKLPTEKVYAGYNRQPSEAAVDKYLKMLQRDPTFEFDPILVVNGKFFEGGHRMEAYHRAGRKMIPVVEIGNLVNANPENWEKWMNGENVTSAQMFPVSKTAAAPVIREFTKDGFNIKVVPDKDPRLVTRTGEVGAGLYNRNTGDIFISETCDKSPIGHYVIDHEIGHALYNKVQNVTWASEFYNNPEAFDEFRSTSSAKSHLHGDSGNPNHYDYVEGAADLYMERRAGRLSDCPALLQVMDEFLKMGKTASVDVSYYMEEGCGIYAMAIARKNPGSQIYIITPKHGGEVWDDASCPYEVTHAFCRVPNKGDFDVKGKRTVAQMAADFQLEGNYLLKGPFSPNEFYARFMGDTDDFPLYGTEQDINEVFGKTAGKRNKWTMGGCFSFARAFKKKFGGEYVGQWHVYGVIDGEEQAAIVHVAVLKDGFVYDGTGKYSEPEFKENFKQFDTDEYDNDLYVKESDPKWAEVLNKAIEQGGHRSDFYESEVDSVLPKEASEAPEDFNINDVKIRRGKGEYNHVWFAYWRRKKIGWAALQIFKEPELAENERCIWKSNVKEEYRRKGVATKMYDAVAAFCATQGWKLVASPQRILSDEAFGLWNKRDPETLKNDSRTWNGAYIGKEIEYKGQKMRLMSLSAKGGVAEYLVPQKSIGVGGTEVTHSTTWVPANVVFEQLGAPKAASKSARVHDWDDAQVLMRDLKNIGMETELVGGIKRNGVSSHDIDLLLKSKLSKADVIEMFERLEWAFYGNAMVSPEEAAREPEKYHQGWSEILHFRKGEPGNELKVDLWMLDPKEEKTASSSDFYEAAEDARNKVFGSGPAVNGHCEPTSDALYDILNAAGYDASIAYGYYGNAPHSWVQVGDTFIDPTHDQFGGKDILIGKTTDIAFKKKYELSGLRKYAAGSAFDVYINSGRDTAGVAKGYIVRDPQSLKSNFVGDYNVNPDSVDDVMEFGNSTVAILRNIDIWPRFQGMGLGTKLLSKFEREARNRGAQVILLEAVPFSETGGLNAEDLYAWYQNHKYIRLGEAMEGPIYYKELRAGKTSSTYPTPKGIIFKTFKKDGGWAGSGYIIRAYLEGENVGYILIYVNEKSNTCYIADVIVNGEFQNHGIGLLLYREGIKLAERKGYVRFYQGSPFTADSTKMWNRLAREYTVETDKETGAHYVQLGKEAKTASPDFGYSHYNNREDALKKLDFDVQRYGDEVVFSAENPDDERYLPGHIEAHIVGEYMVVYDSFIGTSWTGTGLGQMLYDFAISQAKKMKCRYFVSYPIQSMSGDGKKAWKRLSQRYTVTTVPTETVAVRAEARGTAYSTDSSEQGRYQIDLSTVAKKAIEELKPGATAPRFVITNFEGVEEPKYYHTGYPKFKAGKYVPTAFYIEVPKGARDHFWEEPPEHNMEFWAFKQRPTVLKGERIIFTMNKKPVAETTCAFVQKPGESKCDLTGKYEKHWKVYWDPKVFKRYKTAFKEHPHYPQIEELLNQVFPHLTGEAREQKAKELMEQHVKNNAAVKSASGLKYYHSTDVMYRNDIMKDGLLNSMAKAGDGGIYFHTKLTPESRYTDTWEADLSGYTIEPDTTTDISDNPEYEGDSWWVVYEDVPPERLKLVQQGKMLTAKTASVSRDNATFEGKPFTLGAASLLDGQIEETHTFAEGQAAKWHHTRIFSDNILSQERGDYDWHGNDDWKNGIGDNWLSVDENPRRWADAPMGIMTLFWITDDGRVQSNQPMPQEIKAKIYQQIKIRVPKKATKTISGEAVLQYMMKLNKWSKDIALQVLGVDGYGSQYVIKDFPLSRLKAGDDYNPALSKEYAERPTPFPPIVLGYDWNWGTRKKYLVIKDGNHRVDAAKRRGDKTIKAYFPVDDDTTEPSFKPNPGKLSSMDVQFRDEVIDSYSGQDNHVLRALVDGKQVAYIEFSDYHDEPHVQFIHTEPAYRRKGYAAALLKELQRMYPGIEIDLGMTTDDGSKLVQSLKFDEQPTEYADKFKQLEDKTKERDRLQALAEKFYEKSEHTEQERQAFLDELVPNLNTLNDAIWDLEQDTNRQKSTRRLIAKALPTLENLKNMFIWEDTLSDYDLQSPHSSWYLLPDGTFLGDFALHHGGIAAVALGMDPKKFKTTEISEDNWANIKKFSKKFKAIRFVAGGDALSVDILFPPTTAQMRELARMARGNKKIDWDFEGQRERFGKGTFADFQRALDGLYTSKVANAQPEDELPAAPGTQPIPPMTVRLYHYTKSYANLASIRSQGLLTSMGRGDGGTGSSEPSAGIWASTYPPEDHHIFVEFYASPEQISKRAQYPDMGWRKDPNSNRMLHDVPVTQAELNEWAQGNKHVIMNEDIPPSQFLAIHEPWHHHARYMMEMSETDWNEATWLHDPEEVKKLETKYNSPAEAKALAYVQKMRGINKTAAGLRTLDTSSLQNLHDLGPNGKKYSYRVGGQEEVDQIKRDGFLAPHYQQGTHTFTFMSDWPESTYTLNGVNYILRINIPSQGGYRAYDKNIPASDIAISKPMSDDEAALLCDAIADNRLIHLYGPYVLKQNYGRSKSNMQEWEEHNGRPKQSPTAYVDSITPEWKEVGSRWRMKTGSLGKMASDFWHGGRIDGPIDIQAPTKGRYEAGPGLYLTNSYSRASHYAKGGGSTFLVSLKDNLNFADNVQIPLNEGVQFATKYMGGKGKLIAADLKMNCERMKRDTFTADILINLTVNYEAGSGKKGMYLLDFLVSHGVDAALENKGSGEQWVVVFNREAVTKVRKVPANEVTPEMYHLPKLASGPSDDAKASTQAAD